MFGLLRLLNPVRWITSFACFWLKIDFETLEKLTQHKNSTGSGVTPQSNHTAPNQEVGIHINADATGDCTALDVSSADGSDVQATPERGWLSTVQSQAYLWNFNVFNLDKNTTGRPLYTVTMALLELYDLLEGWKLNRSTVAAFMRRVEEEYNPNPYHNNTHAADVTQTAAIILKGFQRELLDIPKLEVFCVIIASAIHDLGHLGVNNDFLINTRHPRAVTYNDKSVNENYHASRAFEITQQFSDCNIFEGFTPEEFKRARQLIIDMVLATDMAIHFDLLKRFQNEINKQPVIAEWTDRNLIYQMIVHLADIANPSRPFFLARNWAERVITEFLQQGDKEASVGLPITPFCNRELVCMPRAQLNFIDIFLKPTLVCCEKAAPHFAKMALEHLELTIQRWSELEQQGAR